MKNLTSIDPEIVRKADSNLRKNGINLERLITLVARRPKWVTHIFKDIDLGFEGADDAVRYLRGNCKSPTPLDPDAPRVNRFIKKAAITRNDNGSFRATVDIPIFGSYYSDARTRTKALANLREELRYILASPVKVRFYAYSRPFTANAYPAHEGGYWATCKENGGSTEGSSMDELVYMLIDMTRALIECK